MSGPKVVRIVTREEVLATCSVLIRRLDGAITRWHQELERLGLADADDIQAVTRRRERIEALLASDRFVDLQKQASDEIAYLERDVEVKRQAAVARAAQRVRQERRQRENAKALLDELERRGADWKGQPWVDSLRRAAAGELTGDEAEAAWNRGFASLAAPDSGSGHQEITEEQKHLAARLKPFCGGEPSGWKHEDPRLKQVDDALASVEVRLGRQAVQAFGERLRALEDRIREPGFEMRLDTLLLDISVALQEAKLNEALIASAREMVAELGGERCSEDGIERSLQRDIEVAIEARDPARLGELSGAARKLLKDRADARAADARRAAILAGLAELGYEVKEGMATAWAKDGRVVVKNPRLPDYGIEFSGAQDASRLLARTVAFSEGRNIARDRDVETIWCGNFGKLREMVSKSGGHIDLERAEPIGSVPLKVVAIDQSPIHEPSQDSKLLHMSER